MALNIDDLVEISLVMTFGAETYMNVYGYKITSGIGDIGGPDLAEAWWNYVKDEYRGLVRASGSFLFSSVLVREMNDPTGVLAEWNIPSGEQQGNRAGVSDSEFLPPFNAAGFRLTVGSRVTRPGQKRIPGLLEVDSVGGGLSAAYITALEALCDEVTETLTLAAPAVGFNLTPHIFRKDATGAVTTSQEVVGYVINPNVTSQNSRKFGRGM